MPSNRTCETYWPDPKQSNVVHPVKPRGRSAWWIVQEKSSARFRHGVPAGLSIGKSLDRWNPKAVQQRAKQSPHEARSPERSAELGGLCVTERENVSLPPGERRATTLVRSPDAYGTHVTRTHPARPHRLVLIAAAVVLVIGVVLLFTPWDGLVPVLAWVLIVASVVLGAITLFFASAPRS